DAALVIRDGRVAWVGADRDLPPDLAELPELDAGGAAVLPGLVDCHTHAVWAGSRRDDFTGRLPGAAYSPAGIHSTVAATRAASYDELRAAAQQRITTMHRNGTTTAEVKSGYGLTVDDELKLLDVAASLTGPTVTTTYLGAHVVPQGRDRADYVDEVVATLPAAKARGAQWCDVFCDEGAFTVDEARLILTAAAGHGFGLRIHAEQVTHTGAAALAAELGCASADHLDHVTVDDAHALAAADVVAVLVPVASLYTRSGRWGHARTLTEAGCTLAVATDCNPGTSWCESLPFAMQLACLEMGLPVETVLRAATVGGAKALRRDDIGHLGIGARGDLVVLDADHETDLLAHLGVNTISRTIVGGTPNG
ncbi:MAG: imidazolonepropionase, partial [Frankiaceae bacterium]|nr:imidazolonepropionase [Frankiaceae bacterium]